MTRNSAALGALLLLQPLAACLPPGAVAGPTSSGSVSTSGGAGLQHSTTSGTTGGATSGTTGTQPTGTLQITPASAVLQVQSGAVATLQLTAELGTTTTYAHWTATNPAIATIDQNGLVSASGPQGGSVQVTASVAGQTASATVQVVVTTTVLDGLPPSVAASFSAAAASSATASPSFLYPADGVVIPVNLEPLDFQWQPGTGNTLFQVTVAGPYAVLVGYVQPAAVAGGGLQPDWQPDGISWNNFAQSNLGQTVSVSVAGTPGGAGAPVYGSASQRLTLAASRFAGTIYYWSASAGGIYQLTPGATPQVVYAPPQEAWDGGPNTCLACHAISDDGERLSAEVWGGGDPGTVVDLTASPSDALVPAGTYNWYFSTFGPPQSSGGSLLLTSWNGAFTLRDSDTAAPVPAGSGEANEDDIGCGDPDGDGGGCAGPSWSRDGALLAYIHVDAGSYFAADPWFDNGDLMLTPYSATGQSFGPPQQLVAHDFDGREHYSNLYPSVSVDDSLVAFSHSSCTYAYSSFCDGGVVPTDDELLVVSPGGGTPVELASAEGTDHRNRFPNFSPFKEGGYHWLAFFSQRDYGWVTRGQGQRQIWITALDAPDGGLLAGDPSHPAFWMPGQDPTTMNDKAVWATLPCASAGGACQGNIDCCTGLSCSLVDAGASACVAAGKACGYAGDSCQSASDCCSPFVCSVGICNVNHQ